MTFLAFIAVPVLVLACLLAPVLLSLGERGPDASDSDDGPPPGSDRPVPPPIRGDSASVPLSSVTLNVPNVPDAPTHTP